MKAVTNFMDGPPLVGGAILGVLSLLAGGVLQLVMWIFLGLVLAVILFGLTEVLGRLEEQQALLRSCGAPKSEKTPRNSPLPRKPGPPRPHQGASEPHWNDGTRPQGASLLLPLPPQSAGAPGGAAGCAAPKSEKTPRNSPLRRRRSAPRPRQGASEPHWNDGTRPQGASLLLPLKKGEKIGNNF